MLFGLCNALGIFQQTVDASYHQANWNWPWWICTTLSSSSELQRTYQTHWHQIVAATKSRSHVEHEKVQLICWGKRVCWTCDTPRSNGARFLCYGYNKKIETTTNASRTEAIFWVYGPYTDTWFPALQKSLHHCALIEKTQTRKNSTIYQMRK